MRPTLEGSSRMIASAVVVLPAPVSPTRPNVSPLFIDRLMPLTALTTSSSVTYSMRRFSMERNLSLMSISSSQSFSLGSSASRRPSPSRLNAREVMTMARPGKITR